MEVGSFVYTYGKQLKFECSLIILHTSLVDRCTRYLILNEFCDTKEEGKHERQFFVSPF